MTTQQSLFTAIINRKIFLLTIFLLITITSSTVLVNADPQDRDASHPPMMTNMNPADLEPRMYRDENGVHLEFNEFDVLFMDQTPHILFSTENDGLMLMFTELREIHVSNQTNTETIVNSLNLETLSFQHTDPILIYGINDSTAKSFEIKAYTNFTYQGVPVSLEIPITFSTTQQQASLMNQTYDIPENAIKFGINIKNWPFQNMSNYLDLRLRIHHILPSDNTNMNMEHQDDSIHQVPHNSMNNQLVNMIQAQTPSMNATIGFETIAYTDNNPTPVNITIDNTNVFNLINIRFSAFNQTLHYDPYVTLTHLDTPSNKMGFSLPWIPALIFLGFIIAIIIMVVSRQRFKTPSY